MELVPGVGRRGVVHREEGRQAGMDLEGCRSVTVRRDGGRTGLHIAGRRIIGAGAGIIPIIVTIIILTRLIDGGRPGIRLGFFCLR